MQAVSSGRAVGVSLSLLDVEANGRPLKGDQLAGLERWSEVRRLAVVVVVGVVRIVGALAAFAAGVRLLEPRIAPGPPLAPSKARALSQHPPTCPPIPPLRAL